MLRRVPHFASASLRPSIISSPSTMPTSMEYRSAIPKCCMPSVSPFTVARYRQRYLLSISNICGVFDVFFQKYPAVKSVAGACLYSINHNCDGEYQTEVYAWMADVRATNGKMSYCRFLDEYTLCVASKINAHKKRTIVPENFEATSSSSATPPLVLALQRADPSSSQMTPSRAKTCQAAYDILARTIRKNDKQIGICSRCLTAGHSWIACPNRSDFLKGVGNLVQPDFFNVAGLAEQLRWLPLFEVYKPDTTAGLQV